MALTEELATVGLAAGLPSLGKLAETRLVALAAAEVVAPEASAAALSTQSLIPSTTVNLSLRARSGP